jgi:NifU-like protein
MSVYPEKIAELTRSRTNIGKFAAENASGTAVNFDCGCFVRFSIEIDEGRQTIAETKFTSNGCGYMIAAANIYGKYLDGKALADLHGFDSTRFVEDRLGEIDHTRTSCLDSVREAAKNTFASYRKYRLEEFSGEKALICTCFGVSEETIEVFINANRLVTVNDVVDSCRAGGGCGSCRFLIQEMIDSAKCGR